MRFDEFLEKGIVRKQTPNNQRALSIIEEAKRKRIFLEISLRKIPPKDINPNFIAESSYDIIIQLLRAKMLIDGYSAANSHEAEVAYMERLGFNISEINTMNELRYYRNGTKYYGTILTRQYAEKSLKFMKKIQPTLKKLLN